MTALYKYRTNKKLTQRQLAKLLGVSQATVGMWEIGERKPNIVMLKKLAHVLELDRCQ